MTKNIKYGKKSSEEACLLCSAYDSSFFNIDNTDKLQELVKQTLNVNLKPEECLPKVVCYQCHYLLQYMNDFCEKSKRNIHNLRMKYFMSEPPASSVDNIIIKDIVSLVGSQLKPTFHNTRGAQNSSTQSSLNSEVFAWKDIIAQVQAKKNYKNGHSSTDESASGVLNGISMQNDSMDSQSFQQIQKCDQQNDNRFRSSPSRSARSILKVTGQAFSHITGDLVQQEMRDINVIQGPSGYIKLKQSPSSSSNRGQAQYEVNTQFEIKVEPLDVDELQLSTQPILEPLYAGRVEPALLTESGGAINASNDKITATKYTTKFYNCTICKQNFRGLLKLRRHLTTHTRRGRPLNLIKSAKDFICLICNEVFETKYRLTKHEVLHKKKYTCPECKREFTGHMDWWLDVAVCTGMKRAEDQSIRTRSKSRAAQVNGPIPPVPIPISSGYQNEPVVIKSRTSSTRSQCVTPSDMPNLQEDICSSSSALISTENLEQHGQEEAHRTLRSVSRSKELLTDTNTEQENNASAMDVNQEQASRARSQSRQSNISTFAVSMTPFSDENMQEGPDHEDDNDDAASMYSNLTSYSMRSVNSNVSVISSRTDYTKRSTFSMCSGVTTESIRTKISELTSTRRQTRSVTRQLRGLEQDLVMLESRSSSRASIFSDISHSGLMVRHKQLLTTSNKGSRKKLNKSKYACIEDNCEESFEEFSALMEHEVTRHKVLMLFKCRECRQRFTRKKYLDKHDMDSHNSGPFICIYCDDYFDYSFELQQHLELHNEGSYRCNYERCDKSFLKQAEVMDHMDKVHRKRPMEIEPTEDDIRTYNEYFRNDNRSYKRKSLPKRTIDFDQDDSQALDQSDYISILHHVHTAPDNDDDDPVCMTNQGTGIASELDPDVDTVLKVVPEPRTISSVSDTDNNGHCTDVTNSCLNDVDLNINNQCSESVRTESQTAGVEQFQSSASDFLFTYNNISRNSYEYSIPPFLEPGFSDDNMRDISDEPPDITDNVSSPLNQSDTDTHRRKTKPNNRINFKKKGSKQQLSLSFENDFSFPSYFDINITNNSTNIRSKSSGLWRVNV